MSRVLNDPIHGHIEVEKELFSFIDTPQFQRLRNLSQLGTGYLVFPGASHRRFEHSIGTCHLAGEVVTQFQQKQPELGITEREKFLVKLAGLCHDLGHGPYSHVFDNTFVPMVLGRQHQYSHEDMSLLMFDHLIDDNYIEMEADDVKFVKALIHPKSVPPASTNEKKYLFDIVSNSRNSVDVDKFDYISRDCLHLGMKSSFDSRRLVMMSRVIDDQICFNAKESNNLYELFHMRYRLHKEVYQHQAAKACELMICDVLREADPVYDFRGIVQSRDPARFMRLTDNILTEIEWNSDERLAHAHTLIKRLHKRQLYKFVGETLLNGDLGRESITAKTIFEFCDTNSPPAGVKTRLQPTDILVDIVSINYGLKRRDPVEHTKFFSTADKTQAFRVQREKVSHMLPHVFEERLVRLFVKKPEYMDVVHTGFMKFIRHNRYRSPLIQRTESEVDLLARARSSSNSTSRAADDDDEGYTSSQLQRNDSYQLSQPLSQTSVSDHSMDELSDSETKQRSSSEDADATAPSSSETVVEGTRDTSSTRGNLKHLMQQPETSSSSSSVLRGRSRASRSSSTSPGSSPPPHKRSRLSRNSPSVSHRSASHGPTTPRSLHTPSSTTSTQLAHEQSPTPHGSRGTAHRSRKRAYTTGSDNSPSKSTLSISSSGSLSSMMCQTKAKSAKTNTSTSESSSNKGKGRRRYTQQKLFELS